MVNARFLPTVWGDAENSQSFRGGKVFFQISMFGVHSGQIIATSSDLTAKGALVRDIRHPLLSGKSRWRWNIVIWPDSSTIYQYKWSSLRYQLALRKKRPPAGHKLIRQKFFEKLEVCKRKRGSSSPENWYILWKSMVGRWNFLLKYSLFQGTC